MTRIVVGVDDSPGGRAALDWALEEARLRSADLEVTYAVTLPLNEGLNRNWPEDEKWYMDQGDALLDRLLTEAHTDDAAVKPVAVVIRSEGPAFGLLERSEGADMLVVGSRGMGGFKGMLLGSVSNHCVHHATCPVVVVRPPVET
jgi:nucleotide-binding universal stress UspA family protein